MFGDSNDATEAEAQKDEQKREENRRVAERLLGESRREHPQSGRHECDKLIS